MPFNKKEYQRQYMAKYRANPDFKKYCRQMHKNKTKWLQQYKANHPCIVCGEPYPVCLDFHHIKPTGKGKKTSIGTMIHTQSIKKVRAEIKKCVVLCSNCHRKVHDGIINLEDYICQKNGH